MEINLLRALALMQHNQEDYFIIDDENGDQIAFVGKESEVREEFESSMTVKKYKKLEENDDLDTTFLTYCKDKLNLVDEIDGDDYNADYMVLTDDEAEQKWDEELESYIEECILHELPEAYRAYFDKEGWKEDARVDGRGRSLGRYDSREHWEEVEGETFYIYRIN